MPQNSIIREVTPLSKGDCLQVFSRTKTTFDFPLHHHDEYEINLILNARGAKRVIGGNVDTIDNFELVLVGPNLKHGWFTHHCRSENIKEITLQFHHDLFDDTLLCRTPFIPIRTLLERAKSGVHFSADTAKGMVEKLTALSRKNGFAAPVELLSILHDLALSRNMRLLSSPVFTIERQDPYNRKIDHIMAYITENYKKQISLTEAAEIAGMSPSTFSRFIKKRTGKTFLDCLYDIRLEHAARILIETTDSIAEVGYQCGFNSIPNFNRTFKRKKHCVPKEFRDCYAGHRKIA